MGDLGKVEHARRLGRRSACSLHDVTHTFSLSADRARGKNDDLGKVGKQIHPPAWPALGLLVAGSASQNGHSHSIAPQVAGDRLRDIHVEVLAALGEGVMWIRHVDAVGISQVREGCQWDFPAPIVVA